MPNKNIILQHWSGKINELTALSVDNIKKYADKVGAEHRLLRGPVFRSYLSSPCQKLAMLGEEFDDYDVVVMMDPDMFTRKGMNDNIFTDTRGIGRHTEIQDHLVVSLERRFPLLGNPSFPYWGGSIYRLEKDMRKKLRAGILDHEMLQFSNNYEDEGIMHRLAQIANLKVGKNTYLPRDHWNCSSFDEGVDKAAIIHIRTKIKPGGPKLPKIENYRHLVERGLI